MKRLRVALVVIAFVATELACSSGVPDYQPDDQPGLFIHQRATKAHAATYFTAATHPVFSVSASQSTGSVQLYVLNQRHDETRDRSAFRVLCTTARLVSAGATYTPAEADAQLESQPDTWRIGACSGESVVNGEDQLIGVVIRFDSGTPLADKFSLELPEIDFGSGPTQMQPETVSFSKRLVDEAGGIH